MTDEHTQQCPSCASPIAIDARWTKLAVCTSCQTAVTFDEGAAALAGVVALLPPSRSKLFVGAAGAISGRPFQALGRVRFGWERGYWDEWHILWTDDGATGWLSEDEDRIAVEALVVGAEASVRAQAEPGTAIPLDGQVFTVVERGVGTLEGAEGQLPFKVVQGEATPFLDLRSEDGMRIASAEFGLDGTRVFVGRLVAPDDVSMDWTRQELGIADALPLASKADGSVPRIQSLSGGVRPLKCTTCGGGLEVAAGEGGQLPSAVECAYCGTPNTLGGKSLPCPNCSEQIDTVAGDAKVAQCKSCSHQIRLPDNSGGGGATLGFGIRNGGGRFKPGDTWEYEGVSYTVTGRLKLKGHSDGEAWHYWEYCLFEPTLGYRWLVSSDGKWTLGQRIFDYPALARDNPPGIITYQGTEYRVTETNNVTIAVADGELPWVAAAGDTCRVLDTQAQFGHAISVEWSSDEVEWYLTKAVPSSAMRRGGSVKAAATVGQHGGMRGHHGRWLRHVILLLLFSLIGGLSADQYVRAYTDSETIKHVELEPIRLHHGGIEFPVTLPDRPVQIHLESWRGLNGTALEAGWVHYTVKITDVARGTVQSFTSTHSSFYHGGSGPGEHRNGTRYGLRLNPGPHRVHVTAVSGTLDGLRSPIRPTLKMRLVTGMRANTESLRMVIFGIFAAFCVIGLYGLLKLDSKRATAPRLPVATVVWALAVFGALGWGVSGMSVPDRVYKPVVNPVPQIAVVPGYANMRAAARRVSVRSGGSSSSSSGSSSSSSSSSRSYSGGGYSSGK